MGMCSDLVNSCALVHFPNVELCYQIAAVADGLLCGLVGMVVARLGENCKWLLGDGFDGAGIGYGLA